MSVSGTHSLWYKDAIIYELHVKAFFDSTDDGRGDFRGLIEKLDYLQDLGITAVWLLPFYPSPLRDDGYDIADYRGVHPEYGTLRDFRAFVREAHRREIRVITELVVNHTSDQHPWFQAARRAKPHSARRDFYVWSDTDTKFPETRVIFTDTEKSNWSWDPVAGAYYWHRFFSHQPDLNHNNPRVVQAVGRVLRFWLDMGVDGLRLDAVPYLCVREGTNNENLPETHAAIKELRRIVDEHYQDRMLLAEANQWPTDVRPYFGDGDECHMAFHFPLMPRIFMALRQEDRRPIVEILEQTPELPEIGQWALFLRNHDELTLEMVTDEERDYMYREYARDARMRVNVGIRRRLAPLVDNGRRRIELLNSLLFSLPGTPVIYYGDELGMGDNIYLGDRDGVRTPMQWTVDRNAGFSRCDPARLYLPLIMDPVYGYQAVNVEAQQRNPSSLLHFMKQIIALRRQHKAFGRGTLEILKPRNRKILAYLRRWRGESILCVANLSRYVQPCELDLSAFRGAVPVEMIGLTEFPPIGDLPYFLTLGPHAFFWFQLEPEAQPLHLSEAGAADLKTLPWLTLEEGLDRLFAPEYRHTLAHGVLAPFLRRQSWFRGVSRDVVSIEVRESAKLGAAFHLAIVDVHYRDAGTESYTLPLKVTRGEAALRVIEEAPGSVMARVRTAEGDGVLFDALADRQACATLYAAMVDGRDYTTALGGRVRAFSSRSFVPASRDLATIRVVSKPAHTTVVLDDAFVLKLYRRFEEGPNPDFEVGRFLTERTSFRRIVPVAGGMEHVRDAAPATIAALQVFVPHDRDGWEHVLGLLDGYLRAARGRRGAETALPPADLSLVEVARCEPPPIIAEIAGAALESGRLLGSTTAELHRALASDRRDPDFAPVGITPSWLRSLGDELRRDAQQVLALLGGRLSALAPPASAAADELLSRGAALVRRFQALGELAPRAARIRVHGDYHLGRLLVAADGFVVTDFEGEPLRPLVERRRKLPVTKDLASMLRSFGYAAHSAYSRAVAERPETADVREPWVRAFEVWVGAAFLGAYLAAAGRAPFLPDRDDDLQTLLDVFVLSKAFDELRYALNSRPDWIPVALEGIRSISGRDATEDRR
jgi:maltose alpha-D-glucosyltransferase/alpha-amylase